MHIYVASKFENAEAVRAAHRALEEDGHKITHDWTGESAAGLEGEALESYLRKCAEKDTEGVLSAHGILVLNHQKMAGGFSEFGMAIAKRWRGDHMCIVVIDGRHEEKPRNIFFHLDFINHAKDLDEARHIFLAAQEAWAQKGWAV